GASNGRASTAPQSCASARRSGVAGRVCSSTGEVPADPAGRLDVAVERADVGAVAAGGALDDLAVAEVEGVVAGWAVVVAEEDDVTGLVAARWWAGADAAGRGGCLGGRVVVGEASVRGPFGGGGEPGVDAGLSERPADVHRAVAGRRGGCARLHLLEG